MRCLFKRDVKTVRVSTDSCQMKDAVGRESIPELRDICCLTKKSIRWVNYCATARLTWSQIFYWNGCWHRHFWKKNHILKVSCWQKFRSNKFSSMINDFHRTVRELSVNKQANTYFQWGKMLACTHHATLLPFQIKISTIYAYLKTFES